MGYADDMPENQGGKTIMFAPWPKPLDDEFKAHYGLAESDEKFCRSAERVCRARPATCAAPVTLPRARRLITFSSRPASFAPHDLEVMKLLLNAEKLDIVGDFTPPKGAKAPEASSLSPVQTDDFQREGIIRAAKGHAHKRAWR